MEIGHKVAFEDVLQAVCLEHSLLHPNTSPNELFDIAIEYKRFGYVWAHWVWAKDGGRMREIAATALFEALDS